MDRSHKAWVNGIPAGSIDVYSRGLAYGDGVFETIRVMESGPVLLDYHLQRLQAGLDRLSIGHDSELIRNELSGFIDCHPAGVTKLIVTRGDGGRGYSVRGCGEIQRILSWSPQPTYADSWFRDGVRVYVCKNRLSRNSLLAGIKHLNRLESVMARSEWDSSEYQEGLVLDTEGNVVEGVFSNLFWVKDGCLLTPSLEFSGVKGTMRRWIMETSAKLGISCQSVFATLEQLVAADELFFCNSVYGIWPVRELHTETWEPGKLTCRLQQKLQVELFHA